MADPRLEEAGGVHMFKEKNFGKFTTCAHCSTLLWGLWKQGLECRRCGIAVHKKCAPSLARPCPYNAPHSVEPPHPSPPGPRPPLPPRDPAAHRVSIPPPPPLPDFLPTRRSQQAAQAQQRTPTRRYSDEWQEGSKSGPAAGRGALLSDIRRARNVGKLRHVTTRVTAWQMPSPQAQPQEQGSWRNRSSSAGLVEVERMESQNKPYVRMLYDFVPSSERELGVSALAVLEDGGTQGEWRYVRSWNGTAGYVPTAFTESLTEQEALRIVRRPSEFAIAKSDWQTQDEKELTVRAGDLVGTVSSDIEEGWTLCHHNGIEGLLPTMILQKANAPAAHSFPAPSMNTTTTMTTTTTTTTGGGEGASSSVTTGSGTKEEDLCKVCMERTVDVLILWCGHYVSCSNCASVLKNCPICRGPISRLQKIFKA